MDPTETWKLCFAKWPPGVAHKGIVVTKFDEQIPFCEFFVSESMVLFERSTPDTIGARKVIVPYEQIAAVKLVDVVKGKAFEPLGFQPVGTA